MYFFLQNPLSGILCAGKLYIYIWRTYLQTLYNSNIYKVKQKSTYDLFNQNKLSYELASNSYANVSNSLWIFTYLDKYLSMSSESLTSATNQEALVIVDYISRVGKVIWDFLVDAFLLLRHEQYDVQSKLLVVLIFWLFFNLFLIGIAWQYYGQNICEKLNRSSEYLIENLG